jgi:peptidoglycan/LPS O-acetylase OafA/YrhL
MLFGIRYTLPGVFEGNIYPNAMNGSLWTLPIEIKLYIYLAILAAFTLYRPALLFAALVFIFAGMLIWFHATSKAVEAAYSQQFAVVFIVGAMLAIVERSKGFGVACAIIIPIAAITIATTSALTSLMATAIAAIIVGRFSCPSFIRPPVDISYGLYLYAFPIQQLVSSYGLAFWPSLALSSIFTVILAILSAIVIERPMIKQRYLDIVSGGRYATIGLKDNCSVKAAAL